MNANWNDARVCRRHLRALGRPQNKRCKDKKKSILYKQMQQNEKVSSLYRMNCLLGCKESALPIRLELALN